MSNKLLNTPVKRAWCLYDWAHSVWPVIVVTFVFPNYFSRQIAPDTFTGSIMWGHAMTVSGLLIALITPFIGVIADTLNNSMLWLRIFTIINVICAYLLWFAYPEGNMALYLLSTIVIGTVAFEVSSAFYNAMLTQVCESNEVSKLSGLAWGLGYIAGIICLVICFLAFVFPDNPIGGFTEANQQANVRIIGPVVAVWYLIFSLPLMQSKGLDQPKKAPPLGELLRSAYKKFMASIRKARETSHVFYYLIIRMIYTDGINALFAFAGLYAANTFDMDMNGIMLFGITCNLACGIGAIASGWVDSKIGEQQSLIINLSLISAFSAAILLVNSLYSFWIMALIATLFIGPIQASSRSLMAKICPEESKGEFFGLYALSGRITSFLGPLVLTELTVVSGSQRVGMASIIIFFLIGLAGLVWLKLPENALFKEAETVA